MSSNLTKLLRLNTQKGPKSIGPYSTASIYKGIMYISGQIGLDPTTGQLAGKDVQTQAKRAMDNLKLFMDEVKVDMNQIIRSTLYLRSMNDFAKVNAIYSSYFPDKSYPARTAIAVADLPKGALFEVQVMVAVGDNIKPNL